MKTVLILSFSHLHKDPRVRRQIEALNDSCKIITLGLSRSHILSLPGHVVKVEKMSFTSKILSLFDYIKGSPAKSIGRKPHVIQARKTIREIPFDLVIANDIEALACLYLEKSKAPILFDAHEFYPEQHSERLSWKLFYRRFFFGLCREVLGYASKSMTVGPGLSELFLKNFNISFDVVLNAPFFREDLQPNPLANGKIKLVHHGIANRSRQLEKMVELVKLLDPRFSLDFYLVHSDSKYIAELKKLAGSEPRIRILPPMPADQMLDQLNSYDVGLYILPPTNMNCAFALPNKFFEFIQARLMLAISGSIDMTRLGCESNVGLFFDEPDLEKMATQLNGLTSEKIYEFKTNSHRAAESLSFSRGNKTITSLVHDLIPGR